MSYSSPDREARLRLRAENALSRNELLEVQPTHVLWLLDLLQELRDVASHSAPGDEPRT